MSQAEMLQVGCHGSRIFLHTCAVGIWELTFLNLEWPRSDTNSSQSSWQQVAKRPTLHIIKQRQ